ncbi:hypothetical protein BH20ACI1_BH20ACI1_19020 [soil metagenome]
MQNVQFITDAEGHKTAVILPIEDYEEMLEDLHFGKVARESKDEPKRDFNEFLEEVRQNGKIDVLNTKNFVVDLRPKYLKRF